MLSQIQKEIMPRQTSISLRTCDLQSYMEMLQLIAVHVSYLLEYYNFERTLPHILILNWSISRKENIMELFNR